MTEGSFTLSADGPIAVITHNRPEKRNALTTASLIQLKGFAESLTDRTDVRAVIFRAEGRDFSVGADIGGLTDRRDASIVAQVRRSAQLGSQLMRAIREIHQPTVCAVQGIATGGGACIATACDFRIGAADARIGYGEVKLGINLMWHALPLAIQTVGLARAKRMVMSGDLFDAPTMLAWGFFDEVVILGEQDRRAHEWAELYAALPPIAVQMIKRSANAYAGALDQAIMHADADQWLIGARSRDFGEAVAAFFEKRSVTYQGD